jgi:hypothetical protein
VGTGPTGQSPFGLTVAGRYAYVANQTGNSISIVDVANPLSGKLAKTVSVAGTPISISVVGRYANVVTFTGNKVSVVDLGGTETNTLTAGSVDTGSINTNLISALGSIFAGNSIFAGLGGIVTEGSILGRALGISGQGTFGTTTVSTTSTLTIQAISDSAPVGLTLVAYGTATGTSVGTASTSQLRFGSSDGKYVGFQAPGTIGTSTVWMLPGGDGTANQILVTNGAGVLTWGSAAVAAGNNQIQFTTNAGSQAATGTFSFATPITNPYGTLILATTSTSSLVTSSGLSTNALYAGGNIQIATTKLANGTTQGNAIILDSATTTFSTTTNALYNNGGTLYWNGVALSSNATGSSYMPVLMNESSKNGQNGMAFIYRNQIYTFGVGDANYPYGYQDGGTDSNGPTILPVVNPPTGWNQIAGSHRTACALSNVGTVYCWGGDQQGQLGTGGAGARYYAAPITFPVQAGLITQIYSVTNDTGSGGTNSGDSFYALDANGRVFAWGYNAYGQLGDGTTALKNTPVQVGSGVWATKTITKLAVGNQDQTSVAAIDSTGQLYTWGHNGQGQLGLGNTTNQSTPVAVPGMTNVTSCPSGPISFQNSSELVVA